MSGVTASPGIGRAAGRLCLAAALALPGCGERSAGDATGDPSPSSRAAVGRRFHPVVWTPVFRVGGTLEDTLLLEPGRLAADDRGVVLADLHGGRVSRFDPAGGLVWSFGRKGNGPDELAHPRDLKLDANGRVWILDVGNGRLVVLDPGGRPVRRLRLGAVGRLPDDFVPLADGGALFLVGDARRPLVRLAPDGAATDRRPFPWAGFAELDPLASQLIVASHAGSGRWAAAFQLGDGFFLARDERLAGGRHAFVEPVPFPSVIRRGSGGPLGRRETVTGLAEPRFAAWSIALSAERLLVLFVGRTADAGRLLDLYDLADGAYRATLRLPRKVDQVAWGGGVLYASYRDPFPTLVAWRPAPTTLP